MGLLTLSIYAFLARGGEVIEFYLVPLLPLLALNIALIYGLVADGARAAWGTRRPLHPALLGGMAAVLTVLGVSPDRARDTPGSGRDSATITLCSGPAARPTRRTRPSPGCAITCHRTAPSSPIATCGPICTTAISAPVFSRAHWHWKVDEDSAILGPVFKDTWRTTDYVVTTIQLLQDTRQANLTTVKGA